MTTTFDPHRFQRELQDTLDRRRIALQGEDDINRRIHETAITVAVEMISNALDKSFVATPPPGCGVTGPTGTVLGGAAEILKRAMEIQANRARDAELARPTYILDADDRAHLRTVVNSDVKDDGARILLHRLINASGPQRTLLDAQEAAGWKMDHAFVPVGVDGACFRCGRGRDAHE